MEKSYRERCNKQIDLLRNVVKNLQEIHNYWNKDEDLAKIYEKGGMWHDDYYNLMKDVEEWARYRIKDFKRDVVVSDLLCTIRQSEDNFEEYEVVGIMKDCLDETKKEYEEEIKNGTWR